MEILLWYSKDWSICPTRTGIDRCFFMLCMGVLSGVYVIYLTRISLENEFIDHGVAAIVGG